MFSNQFHDVLPGSSIGMVYKDAEHYQLLLFTPFSFLFLFSSFPPLFSSPPLSLSSFLPPLPPSPFSFPFSSSPSVTPNCHLDSLYILRNRSDHNQQAHRRRHRGACVRRAPK